jgi:C4-dicarboxylate-specific signal transduction histidine kinase
MPDNNGELRIFTASKNGKFILRIEDNGCGISPDNFGQIFEPYFSKKAGGLGIGLATTFAILKTNKVTITVESEIGTGTAFILSFSNRNLLPKKTVLKPRKDLQLTFQSAAADY